MIVFYALFAVVFELKDRDFFRELINVFLWFENCFGGNRYLFVLIKRDRERYTFNGNGLCITILPLCITPQHLWYTTQQASSAAAGPKAAHGPRR